jgi:hypothetical protein
MLWLSYADRLQDLIDDWRPRTVVEKDQFATLVMDDYALRGLGSIALARASRGDEDVAALSVLKILGAEAVQAGTERALSACGADGLTHPGTSGRYVPLNLDQYAGSWAAATSAPSRARSRAARRKSSETSSRSACWDCRGADVA